MSAASNNTNTNSNSNNNNNMIVSTPAPSDASPPHLTIRIPSFHVSPITVSFASSPPRIASPHAPAQAQAHHERQASYSQASFSPVSAASNPNGMCFSPSPSQRLAPFTPSQRLARKHVLFHSSVSNTLTQQQHHTSPTLSSFTIAANQQLQQALAKIDALAPAQQTDHNIDSILKSWHSARSSKQFSTLTQRIRAVLSARFDSALPLQEDVLQHVELDKKKTATFRASVPATAQSIKVDVEVIEGRCELSISLASDTLYTAKCLQGHSSASLSAGDGAFKPNENYTITLTGVLATQASIKYNTSNSISKSGGNKSIFARLSPSAPSDAPHTTLFSEKQIKQSMLSRVRYLQDNPKAMREFKQGIRTLQQQAAVRAFTTQSNPRSAMAIAHIKLKKLQHEEKQREAEKNMMYHEQKDDMSDSNISLSRSPSQSPSSSPSHSARIINDNNNNNNNNYNTTTLSSLSMSARAPSRHLSSSQSSSQSRSTSLSPHRRATTSPPSSLLPPLVPNSSGLFPPIQSPSQFPSLSSSPSNFLLSNALSAGRYLPEVRDEHRRMLARRHNALMVSALQNRASLLEARKQEIQSNIILRAQEKEQKRLEKIQQQQLDHLQSVQKHWLCFIQLALREVFWKRQCSNLDVMRKMKIEREQAARKIQRFIRAGLRRRRAVKTTQHLQALRTVMLFCSYHHGVVKRDRAANIIKLFLEQMSGVDSMSRVMKNYRKRVIICQRAIKRYLTTKRAKINGTWRRQWDLFAKATHNHNIQNDVATRDALLRELFNTLKKRVKEQLPTYAQELDEYREYMHAEHTKQMVLHDHTIAVIAAPKVPRIPAVIDEDTLKYVTDIGVEKCKQTTFQSLMSEINKDDEHDRPAQNNNSSNMLSPNTNGSANLSRTSSGGDKNSPLKSSGSTRKSKRKS